MKWILRLVALIAIATGIRITLGWVLQSSKPGSPPVAEALRAHARELHQDAIVVDGHNDVANWILDFGFDLGMDGDESSDRSPMTYAVGPLTWLPNPPYGDEVGTDIDLARAREGGLDVQFLSAWVECDYYESGVEGSSRERALEKIEAIQGSVGRNSSQVELAATVEDVERIVSEGKLAAFLAIEGGHVTEDDLANLREFYELGVRRMTLTHDCNTNWADALRDEPFHNGLTQFGHQVVEVMNRLGMIVDISHVSDETFWDTIEVSRAPIIASHSGARAIAGHPRNLSDDMIRAVAKNDGVVMVNFATFYTDPRKVEEWQTYLGWYWFTHPRQPETPLSYVVDHIDHVARVGGVDHVGLGSDFDGAPFLPEGLQDVGDLPNITIELVRRGYSDEDIRKILGSNLLRVLADVETAAAGLRAGARG